MFIITYSLVQEIFTNFKRIQSIRMINVPSFTYNMIYRRSKKNHTFSKLIGQFNNVIGYKNYKKIKITFLYNKQCNKRSQEKKL